MSDQNHVGFNELYYMDFELSDIFAMRQKWDKGVTFCMSTPRKTTGIIYLKNCKGIYTNEAGESFIANEKSIVCLPQGSRYTCLNVDCTNTVNDAILIQFNVIRNKEILFFSDSPFIIKNINSPIAAEFFDKTVAAYEATVPSPLEVKTEIYRLISYFGRERAKEQQTQFSAINTGIELIESNPLMEISIEEIAKACNVSPCYFRRLFKEYASKSPHKYRMELRLNMAKRMLESGEYSIEYISKAVNFETSTYFCRIFKKWFGMTPSEYRDRTVGLSRVRQETTDKK